MQTLCAATVKNVREVKRCVQHRNVACAMKRAVRHDACCASRECMPYPLHAFLKIIYHDNAVCGNVYLRARCMRKCAACLRMQRFVRYISIRQHSCTCIFVWLLVICKRHRFSKRHRFDKKPLFEYNDVQSGSLESHGGTYCGQSIWKKNHVRSARSKNAKMNILQGNGNATTRKEYAKNAWFAMSRMESLGNALCVAAGGGPRSSQPSTKNRAAHFTECA